MSSHTDFPSSSDLTSTDYESAHSHLESESEVETTDHSSRHENADDNTHSSHDLNNENSIVGQQDTTLRNEVQDDDSDESDESSIETYQQEPNSNFDHEAAEDIATDPIQLARTISIARSHKSFNDNESIYGPPTTSQNFLSSQTEQGDDFHLALTRTLSRKSITKEQMVKDEKLQLAIDQGKVSPEEDEGVDASTLEWDSPTDKDNPKNWNPFKKWFVTMITACICLSVTFGSSLYVCGVPYIMIQMNVSQELAISGLTFYMLGLAFGPALSAPLSELYGRRVVYVSSLPISMLLTMGVGLSSKIREILVLRFFSGLFASPAMAVAGGTIADLWDYDMMGLAMAGFCLAPFMGPVLGPIIGGFVAEKKGWKWTMWVNLMMAGWILIPVILTPETYKPIILKGRAKKRGIKLAKPKVSGVEFLKLIFTVTLMTPIKMLFVEPIVMVFSIYIAFIFAVLFGFFEAYPIIFRGVYKMSLGISGLTFLGICVGFIIGTIVYVCIDRFVFFPKNPDGTRGARDENGKPVLPVPESRLLLCKIGAITLPPSLFWLGWSSKTSVHWISSVIAGVPFGFGLILIFFSTMIYFSMTYPPLSLASALAANNLFRYILASVFPLFVVQMYDRLGIDWASSLFAFIALALVPVPWIFEKWGPALRNKSTYGYAAMFKKAQEETARLEKLQAEAENEVLNGSSSDENYNKV